MLNINLSYILRLCLKDKRSNRKKSILVITFNSVFEQRDNTRMSCIFLIQKLRGKGQEKLSSQKCMGQHQMYSGSHRGRGRGQRAGWLLKKYLKPPNILKNISLHISIFESSVVKLYKAIGKMVTFIGSLFTTQIHS